jgi:two-component system, response regulator / RNA-binding antiterminator
LPNTSGRRGAPLHVDLPERWAGPNPNYAQLQGFEASAGVLWMSRREREWIMGAESSPKIVIVDQSPIRAAILEEGLREAGFTGVVHISEMQSLLARIYALDPDIILIDLENPSRDVLEQMFQVSRAVRRPIAMFVDQSDAASIQASVDAGVSAYIVDGLKKERIKPILDLCVSRFNAFSKLQDELDRTKSALEERKVIERAKGILMKLKGLTEDEAYVLLRSTAMREKKKLSEIAQSILTASELLK